MRITSEKVAKEINRGAAVTLAGNVLKLVEFPLTLLAAGLFGVGTWGQYVFLTTLIMPILRFSTLGLDKGLVWFISKHQGFRVAPEFFFRIQKILVALSLLLIAGYGIRHWAKGAGPEGGALLERVSLGLFIASIPFLVLTNMNLGISLGVRKPEHEALIRGILYPVCYLGLPCLLAFSGQGIRVLAVCHLAGSALGYLVSYLFVRPVRARLALHPEGPEARQAFGILFSYSWPLGLRETVLSLQQRMDIWCLALFLPPSYLGVYGLAASVAASVKTVRQSFDNIMLAVIAQMRRGLDTDRITEAYLHAARMVMAVQGPVMAFLVFFARPILGLSGRDFEQGENAVIVFAFTLVLSGYLGLSSIIVMGLNKTRWALLNDIGALAWAVLFNFLLVPRYGVTGAALATSLSILLTNFAWYGEAIYLLKRVPLRASVVLLFLAGLGLLAAGFLAWRLWGDPGIGSRILYFSLYAAAYGAVLLAFHRKGLLGAGKPAPDASAEPGPAQANTAA